MEDGDCSQQSLGCTSMGVLLLLSAETDAKSLVSLKKDYGAHIHKHSTKKIYLSKG
jgi:hypothetical protein